MNESFGKIATCLGTLSVCLFVYFNKENSSLPTYIHTYKIMNFEILVPHSLLSYFPFTLTSAFHL